MTSTPPRPRVILAVDDSPIVRRLVANTLSREFSVISASNGKEALDLLENFRVDLVLTDINMPEMGGLDLADQVLKCFPDIPIAFLSAYLDDDMRIEAGQRSPHMISKPFEVGVLSEHVRQILGESGLILDAAEEAPPEAEQIIEPMPVQPQISSAVFRSAEAGNRASMERNLAAAAIVWQLKKAIESGKSFKARVTEDGMAPSLQKGDQLEVGPAHLVDLRAGDIVFVNQGDSLRARRFVRAIRLGDKPLFLVRADTSKTEDPPLPPTHLIGKIVRAEREGAKLRLHASFGGGGGLLAAARQFLADARNWLTLHATE